MNVINALKLMLLYAGMFETQTCDPMNLRMSQYTKIIRQQYKNIVICGKLNIWCMR